MALNVRPDPDELLASVTAEADQAVRGQLTIFLGYAAGVGKTYAMLQAAHQRREAGVDVVIGYVETHGRLETEALVHTLETVPRREVMYHGTRLTEMDLDALLARKPKLALVDEFAHTNIPDSRHPKRYQDVLEILDAGIDVYTTLNIQHLDSLNDVVAQITGVRVRETVPDSVLDACTDIKVVDLPPDELLQRLRDGKVYVPEQAARAIERFFRKGNLTALREMALRRAAERVDDQMRAYMRSQAISGPWSASERLLVCISGSDLSERLVRAARRLADELNAEWFVLYVEPPGVIGPAERERVYKAQTLAESLGARIKVLPGRDVTDTVLTYARRHNVTKIVVGHGRHRGLRAWWQPSLAEQLIRNSGTIDVHVVGSDVPGESRNPFHPRAWLPNPPFRRYALALALVGAVTAVLIPLGPVLSPTNVAMLFLAAVVLGGVFLGRGPSIVTAALSALCFNFFFVPPLYTFAIANSEYVLTFFGLFVVGVVVSSLALRSRENAEAALRRADELAELYDLSRDLAAAASLEDIARVLHFHIEQTFGRGALVLIAREGKLHQSAASAGLLLDDTERAVADWVYRHGEPAGRNTQTLTAARLRYLPIQTARGAQGVVGVGGPEHDHGTPIHMSPERRRLLEAFVAQAALAIERALLSETAQQAEVLRATERLQTALLNAVSHDLRTPLVTITGALTALQDEGTHLDAEARRALIDNAAGEAHRLNHLVGDLLDMSRLEADAFQLKLEPVDVQDLIGAALEQLGPRASGREILINLPETLPLVAADFVLMTQVLVNVLDNALKYSPPDQAVRLTAHADGPHVIVDVLDRGTGIPPEDLGRIFDKFYRTHRPQNVAGTGLGLAIAKGIVDAHGGTISATARPGGGTTVHIVLPQPALS